MHTEANIYKTICVTVAYGAVLSSKWLCSRNSEISAICDSWNPRCKLLAVPHFLFLLKSSRILAYHPAVSRYSRISQREKTKPVICLYAYLFTYIHLRSSELKRMLRLQSQAIWR